jgi:hypothetical protein
VIGFAAVFIWKGEPKIFLPFLESSPATPLPDGWGAIAEGSNQVTDPERKQRESTEGRKNGKAVSQYRQGCDAVATLGRGEKIITTSKRLPRIEPSNRE